MQKTEGGRRTIRAYCYYAKKSASAVLENRPSVPQIKTSLDNYSVLGLCMLWMQKI